MKEVYIYSLSDPITKEIKYIGKTVKPIKDRLNAHIRIIKKSKYKYKLSSKGATLWTSKF